MTIRQHVFGLMLAFLLAARLMGAEPNHSSADVSAEMNPLSVHAGGKATVAVIVNVHEGLHAQSHTPADEYAIPLEIKTEQNSLSTWGDVRYPAGTDKSYPSLGKLNVYEGKTVFEIPVQISADAKPGPLTLEGTVHFQACNNQMCFPPETMEFSVQSTVVAAAEATAANSNFPHESAAAAPEVSQTVLGEFAGAFLIGIIFNLMPCVLPVLPLKIMGFYEASKHDRKRSVLLGAIFSIGLIASFAVLAVLIVGSHKLKWGEFFQNFWFTVSISVILVVLAIGTFGVFSINVPASLYSFTPRHDTYVGNFLFGVLTAVLSTPCTFGVFAALLAWSLKEPPFIGGMAIVIVGIGMAFPYLVLSAFPGVARNFPRTGPWAGVVKQMMGFFLLASALFFAQPLFPKVSTNLFWWLMFAIIAASGVFLIIRAFELSSTAMGRGIAITFAVLLTAPAFYAVHRITYNPYHWVPFSDQELATAKASGKPVLVDFTADWCTTCHYIEGKVLNNSQVVKTVKNRDVIMIKADMTNDNAPGRPLLSKLTAADEIPLTIVYLPNNTQPKLLNGIYSTDDLLNALGGLK